MATFASLPTLFDEHVRGVGDDQALARARLARERLGKQALVLSHHYQADPIVELADATGDSLELARIAAGSQAPLLVLCGVHFMAETADLLTPEDRTVVLPDLAAGCSMADMADDDQLEACLEHLALRHGVHPLPITYINSSAAVKAVVGRQGGTVCTSSNAGQIVRWALDRDRPVLFVPDQHLGRNTSFALGVPLDNMAVWDPAHFDGGIEARQVERTRVFLWKGHCSVHTRMGLHDVEEWRRTEPDRRILVHPECTFDVVQAADDAGSTSHIVRVLESAPVGSRWAVGTEVNLVMRLARRLPWLDIRPLSRIQCLCSTMFRIDPPHLMWTLENLVEGLIPNPVRVAPHIREPALLAIDRMMKLS